jgi:hypothetical protein
MYSTTAYIYQQRTRVLLLDTSDGSTFTYRWDPVYAKKLTINKGVDNVILFEFINQDQKPVNITGSTFLFRALSQDGTRILVEEPMVTLSATTGRAKVTLTTEQLLTVQAQPASYSIARTQSGGLTEAVFVDAQAGARAPVDIVDSVLPEFVPSSELTIPTLELSNQVSYDGAGYNNWPGGNPYWAGNPTGTNSGFYNSWFNTEFFSSFIEPRGPVTTIQMDLVGYTGTIKVQAAENYQSIWYNVTESTTYFNEYRTIHLNVIGWHPLLRVGFNNSVFATYNPPGVPAVAYAFVTDGVVTNIVVQNGGSGYLAPPKIDIIGNGAGATAEATINANGVVTGITVTNGGSGYWPVPAAGVNTAAYPVPPQNQGAIVSITTGYAINLLYR